jgi:hypothetical protein
MPDPISEVVTIRCGRCPHEAWIGTFSSLYDELDAHQADHHPAPQRSGGPVNDWPFIVVPG